MSMTDGAAAASPDTASSAPAGPNDLGGGSAAPLASGPFDSLMPHLEQEQGQLSAKYDKLMSADKMLKTTRGELDKLLRMGDIVTTDDIVEGAGQLVAAGLDPLAMASLLAEMPSTGGAQALAAWVAQQDAQVQQREQQLEQVVTGIRHQLGVSSMRVLMGHAYNQVHQTAQMAQTPPAQNALTASPGAEGAPAEGPAQNA